MKAFNFSNNKFSEVMKKGNFDDGALFTVGNSRLSAGDSKSKSEKEKDRIKRSGYLLIHQIVMEKADKYSNTAKIFLKDDLLAIQVGKDIQGDNVFMLRKTSKTKYQLNCSVLGKFCFKKYFDNDVMFDEQNKIFAIKLDKK